MSEDINYTVLFPQGSFPRNLSQEETTELSNLQNFIGVPLYFYGSVMRMDYLKNISDVDFCIFTENIDDMKRKIQIFFQISATEECFDKIIWKMRDRMIYGYKMKSRKFINRNYEISIYDERFKKIVLNDHNKGIILSPLSSITNIILKLLKHFKLLDKNTYYYLKKLFYDAVYDRDNDMFIVL